jgi:hypothetical protein
MHFNRRQFLAALLTASLVGCKKRREGPLVCTDVSGLDPVDRKNRARLGYVDRSPKADRNCENCSIWRPKGKNECGGCTVIRGPIHPKGYCRSWSPKT